VRLLFAVLCIVVFPVMLNAQTPVPSPVTDPAYAAAAKLARMSGISTWSIDSAVATDTKKKKDKRALGLGLMIVGVGAIIGGIVLTADGNNGGLAIIIGGGIMEGAGYQMYHGSGH